MFPLNRALWMTEDEPGQWQNLYFSAVKGFTYERGHEYVLRVKRTILANPPQDASNRTYELVRILADKKVEEVAEPVEKEVKSEADIEYEQQCPIEKYAIAKGGEYLVDADCQVTYADGTPTPEFDKDARIYLENILDKSHPLWQAGARYQATYAYVLSPLTDEIRLVPSNRSAITPCAEQSFCNSLQEHTYRKRDGVRPALDETGRNAALRPHPRQCL